MPNKFIILFIVIWSFFSCTNKTTQQYDINGIWMGKLKTGEEITAFIKGDGKKDTLIDFTLLKDKEVIKQSNSEKLNYEQLFYTLSEIGRLSFAEYLSKGDSILHTSNEKQKFNINIIDNEKFITNYEKKTGIKVDSIVNDFIVSNILLSNKSDFVYSFTFSTNYKAISFHDTTISAEIKYNKDDTTIESPAYDLLQFKFLHRDVIQFRLIDNVNFISFSKNVNSDNIVLYPKKIYDLVLYRKKE